MRSFPFISAAQKRARPEHRAIKGVFITLSAGCDVPLRGYAQKKDDDSDDDNHDDDDEDDVENSSTATSTLPCVAAVCLYNAKNICTYEYVHIYSSTYTYSLCVNARLAQ